MPIIIGGGTTGDPSIFNDALARQQALMGGSAAYANSLNAQSNADTKQAGAAGWQANQQQAALGRQDLYHSQDLAHQAAALALAQQQHEQTAQFHQDEIKNRQDALAQQQASEAHQRDYQNRSLAQMERERAASLAERTNRDNTNAGIRDDAETRRLAEQAAEEFLVPGREALKEHGKAVAGGFTDDAMIAKSAADDFFAKAAAAHDAVMKQRQPWDVQAPDLQAPDPNWAALQPFNFGQQPTAEAASSPAPFDASGPAEQAQDNPPDNNPFNQPVQGAEVAAAKAKKIADKQAEEQRKQQLHALEHAEIQAVHKANAEERTRKNEMADLPYIDLKTALDALPDDKTRRLKLQAEEMAARGKPPTSEQAKANPFLQEQLDYAKQRAEDDKAENKSAIDMGHYTVKSVADMWKVDNKPDKERLHAVLRAKKEMGSAPDENVTIGPRKDTPAPGVSAGPPKTKVMKDGKTGYLKADGSGYETRD